MRTDTENNYRPGLLTLPFDLQYYLIAFLEPLDILHLRVVGAYLYLIHDYFTC